MIDHRRESNEASEETRVNKASFRKRAIRVKP
jgi:hypothetical protein